MPVTIYPAGHAANATNASDAAKDPLDLLKRACVKEGERCQEILQSSFDNDLYRGHDYTVEPSKNGFVFAAIRAYNTHQHLHIRPEDVWFAILSQFSFYVNRNSEELRDKFVNFEGKRALTVNMGAESRYEVDFGLFATEMSKLIDQNVIDPDLKPWAMPAFSTTTEDDEIVASILLMGLTKNFFTFGCRLSCGLPSVTLLGERADWQLIHDRLDKLESYGVEPTQFANLLRPVLSRFIWSFDDPCGKDTINFWQKIAHYQKGASGPSFYSGWITAFCFWNEEGVCQNSHFKHGEEKQTRMSAKVAKAKGLGRWSANAAEALVLDEVKYHRVDSTRVPAGYSSVEVQIYQSGRSYPAMMIAGSVGINFVTPKTIKPETGWWMVA